MKVSERLEIRLAKVPKVTPEDIGNWLAEAETESELTEELNANAVFYLALSFAYESIAADAARYFSYTDGEESVDKSMIFANYKKLSTDALKKYRKYRRGKGTHQTFAKRADGR
ncbi:hypothetical protein P4159_20025 [Bacillus thuringiensis]|uniref:hypothetical protein n=1 Tax=Bacillus cereus group TaxID=86661 RepID=UPI0007C17DC5|nr:MULTISPECIES: hypothetical protein [Bacillus cereus group]AND07911.1 hypothetical protein Bt4C1_12115 [Bacillus thuringiensis serovar alesti]MBY0131350.1 hypothetical protein [Bacillus cereus]MEC3598392.1 hypothetical protein [Bacillus thuringiensis]MED1833268.1 hypothetical protein [Bacillus thuringiensis]MED2210233.1 hypothetical protein [Bacillus thuringiensis]